MECRRRDDIGREGTKFPLVDKTWTTRDKRVLEQIVEIMEERPAGPGADLREIVNRTGFGDEDVQRSMKALSTARPPYFREVVEIGELPYPIQVSSVTERALIAAGQWPDPESLVQQLVAALAKAADDEPDPVKRGKLKQAADVIGGAALQIAIAWAAGALPR